MTNKSHRELVQILQSTAAVHYVLEDFTSLYAVNTHSIIDFFSVANVCFTSTTVELIPL